MRRLALQMTLIGLCYLTMAGYGTARAQCGTGTYTYSFTSFCPFAIWVGQSAATSNVRSYPPEGGNWALAARCTANTDCPSGTCDAASGECICSSSSDCSGGARCLANSKCDATATFCMPPAWDSGTFWPRTHCTADGQGGLNCETGQCTPATSTTGLLDCGVGITSSTNPVTQFEVTSTPAAVNYDVSLVAGYNVEMKVAPRGGSYAVPGVPATENQIACYWRDASPISARRALRTCR